MHIGSIVEIFSGIRNRYLSEVLYMEIREADEKDLIGLLELYTQLHNNPMPEMGTINMFLHWPMGLRTD